jgi:hypothetical protein
MIVGFLSWIADLIKKVEEGNMILMTSEMVDAQVCSDAEIVDSCLGDVRLNQPPYSLVLILEKRRKYSGLSILPDSCSNADKARPSLVIDPEEYWIGDVHVVLFVH